MRLRALAETLVKSPRVLTSGPTKAAPTDTGFGCRRTDVQNERPTAPGQQKPDIPAAKALLFNERVNCKSDPNSDSCTILRKSCVIAGLGSINARPVDGGRGPLPMPCLETPNLIPGLALTPPFPVPAKWPEPDLMVHHWRGCWPVVLLHQDSIDRRSLRSRSSQTALGQPWGPSVSESQRLVRGGLSESSGMMAKVLLSISRSVACWKWALDASASGIQLHV